MPEVREDITIVEEQTNATKDQSGNGGENTQVKDRTTEIRSDEVQEILSHTPNWTRKL